MHGASGMGISQRTRRLCCAGWETSTAMPLDQRGRVFMWPRWIMRQWGTGYPGSGRHCRMSRGVRDHWRPLRGGRGVGFSGSMVCLCAGRKGAVCVGGFLCRTQCWHAPQVQRAFPSINLKIVRRIIVRLPYTLPECFPLFRCDKFSESESVAWIVSALASLPHHDEIQELAAGILRSRGR